MPDKAWKAFERVVAKYFGTLRNALSGGNSKLTRSDSLHPDFFIECKYRSNCSLHSLYLSTKEKASKEEKIPVICLKKKHSDGFLIVIHSDDFKNMREHDRSILEPKSQSSTNHSEIQRM